MMVTEETARVWRAAGRRWFTKQSAERAEAKAWMFAKRPCDCSPPEPEYGDGGVACHVHDLDQAKFKRIVRRVVLRLRRAAEAEGGGES